MTVLESLHADHGATFTTEGGRTVVDHYGRPETAHRAVRNGVGAIELAYGVLVVEGDDRVEFVDNAVTNHVPEEDGAGCYALLLSPQGRIETELYVFNAGERLLVFTPPDQAEPLAEDWREKTFIQDVEFTVATDDYATIGVHGPTATEKIASVLHGAGAPEPDLTFVRGEFADAGVTVIAGDALAGEESYLVVCGAADAETVFDAMLTLGNTAIPFGYRTWETLTLEAGTPLFASELDGTIPNVLGLRYALDFEKGCYVGQEVVSRIENRGQPSQRLAGIELQDESAIPEAGAAVFAGDEHVGEVTRAAVSPLRERPIALALVDFDTDATALSVRIDGDDVAAERIDLPFVDGSQRSLRLPTYE